MSLMALAVAWPAGRICNRIGYPAWLGILAIIPMANIVLLWWVALSRWTVSERA